MDINILRQIGVVLGALAFFAVCWWAFSPKRKKRFEEDAKLPFADEEPSVGKEPSAGEEPPEGEEPSAEGKQSSEAAAREDKIKSGSESGVEHKQGQDKQ